MTKADDCEKKHAPLWRYISAIAVLAIGLIVVAGWAGVCGCASTTAATELRVDFEKHDAGQREKEKHVAETLDRIEATVAEIWAHLRKHP